MGTECLIATTTTSSKVVWGRWSFAENNHISKKFPICRLYFNFQIVDKKIPLRRTPLWLELEYRKIQSMIIHRLAILQYLFSDFYIISLAASTSQLLGDGVVQPDTWPFDLLYRYLPYRTTPGPNLLHH